MRPADEIISEFTSDDGLVDLEACIKAFQDEMQGKFNSLTGQDFIAMQEAHTQWAILYLADLVLTIATEVGVLPKGKDVETDNLRTALAFDKTRRMYQVIHSRRGNKIVVPGRGS